MAKQPIEWRILLLFSDSKPKVCGYFWVKVFFQVLLLFLSVSALGQENKPKQKVERIEVIGSHIKRIDLEGVSPVITIDRDEIQSTGAATVSQVLRNFAGSSFGGRPALAGNAAAGAETVSLKGLGATRTLVLLNGRRLVKDPLLQAADLSLIPSPAVERIEILNEAASATYGSEAVGGVINIITRKDFDGSEVYGQRSWTVKGGGESSSLGLITGNASDQSSFIGVLTYSEQAAIRSATRLGERDRYSPIGSPGTYYDQDNRPQAFPSCPIDQVEFLDENATRCRYDVSSDTDIQPQIKRWSGLFDYQNAFSLNYTLYSSLVFSHVRTNDQFAPSPSRGLVMSEEAAQNLNLPNQGEGELVFDYRFVELGPRKFQQELNSYGLTSGLKGSLKDRFDWDLSFTFARTNRYTLTTSGIGIRDQVLDAIASGRFNPFEESIERRGSLEEFRYKPFSKQVSQRQQVDGIFSGELFQLGHGFIRFALGISKISESYDIRFDDLTLKGNVTSGVGGEGGGGRTTQSIYGEVFLEPIQGMEWQLALRFDNFSDFGQTVNPKLAFRYHMTDQLLLRGSWGTGFKAPDLDQLYDAPTEEFPRFIDPVACQNSSQDSFLCRPQAYKVVRGGNPKLREETFLSKSLGVVWQPARSFSLGLNYHDIYLDDVINRDQANSLNQILKAIEAGMDVSLYGVLIVRNADREIERIEAPYLNLANRQVQSLTVDMEYQLQTRLGSFKLATIHSQLLSYKEEIFPGSSRKELIGKDDRPYYRNNLTLLYTSPKLSHRIFATARTIGPYRGIEFESARQRIPAHTEIDVNYAIQLPWQGALELGVLNLFNRPYPVDENAGGVNLDLYRIAGKSYYVGYRQRF